MKEETNKSMVLGTSVFSDKNDLLGTRNFNLTKIKETKGLNFMSLRQIKTTTQNSFNVLGYAQLNIEFKEVQ